ncbi:MAG: lipoprotein-releasing ABC transporter permease subunit [Pseudomonadota bacterium]
MFSGFERLVAFRYLRARRREGFISVITTFSLLGIALGVATLIVVMSVFNGFRSELVGQILRLSGHLSVYSWSDEGLTNYAGLTEQLLEIDGVTAVYPTIEGQAFSLGRQPFGGPVRGVRPEDFLSRPAFSEDLLADPAVPFAGPDTIAIGYRMAARLGLGLGDTLTLVSPATANTAFGTQLRQRAFTIAGIFNAGIFEYDNLYIYMPLEAAQIFYQQPDGVTALEIFLDDAENLDAMREEIRAVIGGEGRIWDWQQANSGFIDVLQVERNVMFAILTMIILVAAFNIISGLVMLVKDKGRAIAILRTMGATRGMIMRIFLITGSFIGVVGTLSGFILGLLIAENLESIRAWLQEVTGRELFPAEFYFLSQLPSEIDYAQVIGIVVMSIGLSFLATLYPSWRAARLHPVEALRYE